MLNPHGLEVALHTADGTEVPGYKNNHAGNNAKFGGLLRSQLIAAKPGEKFTFTLTVMKDFVKFKADGLRIVVVAPYRHPITRKIVEGVHMWWVTLKGGTGDIKYKITGIAVGGDREAKRPLRTAFVMPVVADISTADPGWHKHPSEFRANSGCVAVYIQRGRLMTDQLPEWRAAPLPIHDAQFHEYRNDNGLPYIFEFRNKSLSEVPSFQPSSQVDTQFDSDNFVVSDDDTDDQLSIDEDAKSSQDEPELDDGSVITDLSSSSDSDTGSDIDVSDRETPDLGWRFYQNRKLRKVKRQSRSLSKKGASRAKITKPKASSIRPDRRSKKAAPTCKPRMRRSTTSCSGSKQAYVECCDEDDDEPNYHECPEQESKQEEGDVLRTPVGAGSGRKVVPLPTVQLATSTDDVPLSNLKETGALPHISQDPPASTMADEDAEDEIQDAADELEEIALRKQDIVLQMQENMLRRQELAVFKALRAAKRRSRKM